MVGKRFDRTMMAGLAGVWIALALNGCANVGQQDAQTGAAPSAAAASGVQAAAAPTPDTAASMPANKINAADQGTPLKAPPLVYRVKRGDTLARIAQQHHCSVRQLQTWNGLKASSRLKSGQVLRVASPETVRAVNAANAAAASAKTSSAPAAPLAGQPSSASTTAAQSTAQSAALSAEEAREVAQQTTRRANGVSLAWPAGGRVVESFQPGETRGIEIGGKPGDPVRAAADGKVMYAGTGLNSYGSLIIVQHNKDFLTAYSHNRKLLVKTGDIVKQGQQIAEMGDENNSRVSVGFELRRDGKPIDPMPYLPQGRG
ncbi:peptidoglycan DD-metalloendopeptidase family protein [Paraburkholderia sp. DD10]|jgi:lipoprotein NlpD|uniref:Lipoprotein NlpD n=1 Tax=Paraburkholderia terricola TaxID=169427 RepID=A0A1M6VPZ5_9BURK|nr:MULTISPECIES: peptidoglycan DD-metalloendopeptidase family protein [Paraburkholderia]ORC45793.1 peptidase [Burkholderia sp. A27]SDP07546.1 lipoprotein NlpD [Paraburkholderia sediminicola]SHK83316.1 lipoprotein NlpD [Paraburkholderia terricola]